MENNWKKNIALFLSSQTLSLFGSALVQYAITWHITLTTRSGLMMTIAILCGLVPNFFLSPFAGVWADRFNRKTLIMLSDSMIALSTLVLAICFMLGYDRFELLFVMLAIRSLGTAVQTPAVGAFLPQIVPENQLTRVNGVNASIQAGIMLLAPVLSAALYSQAPMFSIFFIDVFTAAIAVLTLLLFLKIPAHAKANEKQKISYFEDMKIGLRYVNEHSFLKRFFIFFGITTFLATPSAFLTPLQVTRSFGDQVWMLTAVEMTFSIGMMAGGVAMSAWGGFKNRTHTIVMACMLIGAGTAALGLIPFFPVYLGCMVVVGLSIPFLNTPFTVMLQEKVSEDFMGRVFGLLSMLSSSTMPVGMLIFGPLADIMDIEWLLIGSGILIILAGFVLSGNRSLMNAGKPHVSEVVQGPEIE